MNRSRNERGRFSKIKEDTENLIDLIILCFKLILILCAIYCIISYFDLASRVKDFIASILFRDCEVSCNGKSKSYFG